MTQWIKSDVGMMLYCIALELGEIIGGYIA
jgi:hypothetical protein